MCYYMTIAWAASVAFHRLGARIITAWRTGRPAWPGPSSGAGSRGATERVEIVVGLHVGEIMVSGGDGLSQRRDGLSG